MSDGEVEFRAGEVEVFIDDEKVGTVEDMSFLVSDMVDVWLPGGTDDD